MRKGALRNSFSIDESRSKHTGTPRLLQAFSNSAQEVESGGDGAPADSVAGAAELIGVRLRAARTGQSEVDKADRFGRRSSARSRDACDAQTPGRTERLADAF